VICRPIQPQVCEMLDRLLGRLLTSQGAAVLGPQLQSILFALVECVENGSCRLAAARGHPSGGDMSADHPVVKLMLRLAAEVCLQGRRERWWRREARGPVRRGRSPDCTVLLFRQSREHVDSIFPFYSSSFIIYFVFLSPFFPLSFSFVPFFYILSVSFFSCRGGAPLRFSKIARPEHSGKEKCAGKVCKSTTRDGITSCLICNRSGYMTLAILRHQPAARVNRQSTVRFRGRPAACPGRNGREPEKQGQMEDHITVSSNKLFGLWRDLLPSPHTSFPHTYHATRGSGSSVSIQAPPLPF
jgi:hypothetical protein